MQNEMKADKDETKFFLTESLISESLNDSGSDIGDSSKRHIIKTKSQKFLSL